MKRILGLLLVSFMLLGSSLCAASDSSDLAKEQKTADKIMDALNGGSVPEYATVEPLLNAKLAKEWGQKGYNNLAKLTARKLGIMQDSKFAAFQRFDQEDRITYVASFSKEKVVVLTFNYDKTGKLTGFLFNPVQEQKQPETK